MAKLKGTGPRQSVDGFNGIPEYSEHESRLGEGLGLIASLKEWQYLLGGLFAVLAALIFAVASVITARIRAAAKIQSHSSFPDLRSLSGPGRDSPTARPAELVRNLEQLRVLVRVALSDFIPGEKSGADLETNRQSYDRIFRLQLGPSDLPQNAPKSARDSLTSLAQDIEALSHLGRNAPASEITNILISVNTTARTLLAELAPFGTKA